MALLQLHVHARWVRASTLPHVHFCQLGSIDIWLLLPDVALRQEDQMLYAVIESCVLSLLSPQFGTAGVQCFTAVDDWRSFGDGPRHLTNKSPLHGWSACW